MGRTVKLTLVNLALGGAVGVAALALSPRPALACGWSELPTSCDGDANEASNEARWMLKRVVAAVQADEPRALDEFTRSAAGFRTQDLYVFCMNPETGRMSAHPDPKLRDQDARALRDPTGKAFAAEMMDVARVGEVATVSYLYPRPGSDRPVPKTSYVTRIKDQVCGVGFYDVNASADDAAPAPPPTPAAQVAQLRQRLDAEIPASLRPDWTAFLTALGEQSRTQDAAFAKARESVQAAQAALADTGTQPASPR